MPMPVANEPCGRQSPVRCLFFVACFLLFVAYYLLPVVAHLLHYLCHSSSAPVAPSFVACPLWLAPLSGCFIIPHSTTSKLGRRSRPVASKMRGPHRPRTGLSGKYADAGSSDPLAVRLLLFRQIPVPPVSCRRNLLPTAACRRHSARRRMRNRSVGGLQNGCAMRADTGRLRSVGGIGAQAGCVCGADVRRSVYALGLSVPRLRFGYSRPAKCRRVSFAPDFSYFCRQNAT